MWSFLCFGMEGKVKLIAWPLLSMLVGLSGCTHFRQDAHQVLVREPDSGRYAPPADAAPHAKRQWVYAAMSDHAYEAARTRAFVDRNVAKPMASPEEEVKACGNQLPTRIPPEWRAWQGFPSSELEADMRKKGLFLLVLEREQTPREIVVVFEGTNFLEMPDWGANFRWFLRFIPGFEDQYTYTATRVATEFFQRIRAHPDSYRVSDSDPVLRGADGSAIRIVSTGHSLGGGLAQHFAYTFKQASATATGPKVSEVYAFDPSPVTGWFSADDPPRSYNAAGLVIHRIFEHGEVLAYVRLVTSRLVTSHIDPAIWEYRYNFDPRANIIRNHSMRSLACGLARAAAEAP
jgi:hypothetical protein